MSCAARAISKSFSLSRLVTKSSFQLARRLQTGLYSELPLPSEATDEQFAEYEVSKDDFKFVEPLLKPSIVPPIPQHEVYPTPSGWFPPKGVDKSLPYFVRRTKNHVFPIYEEFKDGNTRKLVTIRKIEGDIWAFDADLRRYLMDKLGRPVIASQVHELGGYVRIKGQYIEHVSEFLKEKGF